MKDTFLWSLGLFAAFHAYMLMMWFVMWQNGYKILGAWWVLRMSMVIAVIPFACELFKFMAKWWY